MDQKNALIIGIRDEESVCYAIALELKRAGYTLYATYQDQTTYPGVQRVAETLSIKKLYPYDARRTRELERFTEAVKADGIALDVLVHGISYSTASGAKLGVRLIDLDYEAFTDAIRVGAFSLVEVTGKLLDVMKPGSAVLAVSLRWSQVAVPDFNVVCAAKAALESMIRGLAQSLGRAKEIRVNGISPGFMPTHSLGRVGNALDILSAEKCRSPLSANVQKGDVGTLSLSILENLSITGNILTIDTGVSIVE